MLKYPKIHDINPFGINNQTLLTVAQRGHQVLVATVPEKKPWFFFHDAWNEYAVVLPEKKKFSFPRCWIALLHGII
jgi:hypothetical protein